MTEMCGRCYNEADILFDSGCHENPERRLGEPIGMYHCPECGAMLVAGFPHPKVCQECLRRF
jgi:hypothetical protein